MTRLLWVAGVALALAGCGSTEDDPDPDPMPDPSGADAGAPSGDPLAYMDMCDPDSDLCDGELVCFAFNMKGPHCTHECSVDEDCEAPSPGCNNMGVCKAP
jgi:hypothetical protein